MKGKTVRERKDIYRRKLTQEFYNKYNKDYTTYRIKSNEIAFIDYLDDETEIIISITVKATNTKEEDLKFLEEEFQEKEEKREEKRRQEEKRKEKQKEQGEERD